MRELGNHSGGEFHSDISHAALEARLGREVSEAVRAVTGWPQVRVDDFGSDLVGADEALSPGEPVSVAEPGVSLLGQELQRLHLFLRGVGSRVNSNRASPLHSVLSKIEDGVRDLAVQSSRFLRSDVVGVSWLVPEVRQVNFVEAASALVAVELVEEHVQRDAVDGLTERAGSVCPKLLVFSSGEDCLAGSALVAGNRLL